MAGKIRVLVVDDSALVRDILQVGLSRDPEIDVVGTASDPFEAGEIIPTLKPDVMTLDVEMPRMNGLEFLRRLMPQYPMPVVMVSALTEKGRQLTFDALALGAVDFVAKPKADLARGMELLMAELIGKIKVAAGAKLLRFKPSPDMAATASSPHKTTMARKDTQMRLAEISRQVVIIGASTGGTEAVREVVTRFPVNFPGMVVVQHMPAGFTRLFANRLDTEAAMKVKEAEDGDRLLHGRILVAPGGKQLRFMHDPRGGFKVSVHAESQYNNHAPSVDVTMLSAAEIIKANGIGIILTGMGADGAKGLKAMRDAGSRCFAQNEATSVVFGMPAEAFKNGGAERLLPIGEMAKAISDIVVPAK